MPKKKSAELILTDRFVELIDERMDVVVRIGVLRDSDLIMRKLADNYRITAPDYLESRGTPSVLEDLSSYECLLYRSAEPHWRLVGPAGKAVELKVASRLRCKNGEVAHDWALAGCGLIMKSWVDVACDVQAGRLVRACRGGAASPRLSAPFSPQTRDFRTGCASSSTPMVERLAAISALARAPGFRDRGKLSRPRQGTASAAGPATPPSIPLPPLFGLHDRFTSIRDVAACLKCANSGHCPTARRTGQIDASRLPADGSGLPRPARSPKELTRCPHGFSASLPDL